MTTTAVSFRKGNTEENNVFAGVAGEIVADLGANEQVTEKATIVLHTGNGVAGGIRMARQDLNNITNESINNLANFRQDTGQGTYYGLLRRNLSNYITNDVNTSTVEGLLKSDYHIASKDGHDIDTSTYIAGDPSWGTGGGIWRPAGGKYLMNRDLSNIYSDGLDVIRTHSYEYWLNNVDTSFLAGSPYLYNSDTYTLSHGSPLAYANMSNVDTGILAGDSGQHIGNDLAYKDLTNVGYSTIVSYLSDAYGQGYKIQEYEWNENKVDSINPYGSNLSAKYPTVNAIINYVAGLSDEFTNRDLDNVQSWLPASSKEDFYKIKVIVNNTGEKYQLYDVIQTDIPHPNGGYVDIVVQEVSSTGGVLKATVETGQIYVDRQIADEVYEDTAPVTGENRKGGYGKFTITSNAVHAGKLMLADLSNSKISSIDSLIGADTRVYTHNSSFDTETALAWKTSDYNSGTSTPIYYTDGTTDPVAGDTIYSDSSCTTAVTTISSVAIQEASLTYDVTYENRKIANVNTIQETLADSGTKTSGTLAVNFSYDSGVETKISTDNLDPLDRKRSSIIITKNNAFLNKAADVSAQGVGELKDPNHQLLNRGEMDARYQLQPASALPDHIATFNSSTSTVDSGKVFTQSVATSGYSHNNIPTEEAVRLAINDAITQAVVYKGTVNTENDLPASGNTNGDLYWIRAFSNSFPTASWRGHPGTAIWNGNVTPATWDYKEDTKNDPDGTSIDLNGSGKLTVLLSATASNAITKNNDGLYVDASSFVSSSGYVAVAPVSGQSGKVLTNDGTNTSWRIAIPEPPVLQNSGDTGVYHLYAQNVGGTMQYSWVNDALLSVTQSTPPL